MMMLIGLPKTLPPKSSIAICAAVTEPWPDGVDAGPFMSVRTPILTTSSETCAEAGDAVAVSDRTANDRTVKERARGARPKGAGAEGAATAARRETGLDVDIKRISPPGFAARRGRV